VLTSILLKSDRPFLSHKYCYLPVNVPPQITLFLHHWFISKVCHNKTSAIPKCSSPAAHSVPRTPRQDSSQPKICSSLDSSRWVSHTDSGAEASWETIFSSKSLTCVPCLPLCLCATLGLWRWSFDGLMAPVMDL